MAARLMGLPVDARLLMIAGCPLDGCPLNGAVRSMGLSVDSWRDILPWMVINCHCHIFSLDSLPRGFRQRFMLDVENPRHALLHRVLRALLVPGTRLGVWLDFRRMTTAQIADALVAEMDIAGVELATPLMIDMEYSSAFSGGVRSFYEQIEETLAASEAIRVRYGRSRLLPFIGADPRRPGVAELVIRHLSSGAVHGVKIYPVMGFFPDDPRLYPIFEFCCAHEIPVTSHCEHGGLPGHDGLHVLAAPEHWLPVLKRFPTLKLNLAHFDRTGSPWQITIEEMLRNWPNVYTDISFDAEMYWQPGRYFTNIHRVLRDPVLGRKLLYGTDWYIGRFLWDEASYLRWYTHGARRVFWNPVRFSRRDIARLTDHNPRRFLASANKA